MFKISFLPTKVIPKNDGTAGVDKSLATGYIEEYSIDAPSIFKSNLYFRSEMRLIMKIS